jgi:hypothetical protein
MAPAVYFRPGSPGPHDQPERWGRRPRADEGRRAGRSAAPPAGRLCHARLAEQWPAGARPTGHRCSPPRVVPRDPRSGGIRGDQRRHDLGYGARGVRTSHPCFIQQERIAPARHLALYGAPAQRGPDKGPDRRCPARGGMDSRIREWLGAGMDRLRVPRPKIRRHRPTTSPRWLSPIRARPCHRHQSSGLFGVGGAGGRGRPRGRPPRPPAPARAGPSHDRTFLSAAEPAPGGTRREDGPAVVITATTAPGPWHVRSTMARSDLYTCRLTTNTRWPQGPRAGADGAARLTPVEPFDALAASPAPPQLS